MPPILEIFGVIGWDVTLELFNERLKQARVEFPTDTLLVKINSPGGQADIGWAIAHLIQNDGNIDTMNIGLAASSAGFILQSGKRRFSANQSMTMMHRTHIWADGNATVFEKLAGMLEEWDAELIKVIQDKTNVKDEKFINDLLEEPGWWRNSDNALKDGLIDEIVTTESKQPLPKNSVEFITKNYGTLPFNILNQIIEAPHEDTMNEEQIKMLVAALAVAVANSVVESLKPTNELLKALGEKEPPKVDIENIVKTVVAESVQPALTAINESVAALKVSNEGIAGVMDAIKAMPQPRNHGAPVWGVATDKPENEAFAV